MHRIAPYRGSLISAASSEPGKGARGGGAAARRARSRACLASAAASAAAARESMQCSAHALHSRTGTCRGSHVYVYARRKLGAAAAGTTCLTDAAPAVCAVSLLRARRQRKPGARRR